MLGWLAAYGFACFAGGFYVRGHPRGEVAERSTTVRVARWLRCRKRRASGNA